MQKTHRAVGEESEAAISWGMLITSTGAACCCLLGLCYHVLQVSFFSLPLQCSKNLASITCVRGDERTDLDFPHQ